MSVTSWAWRNWTGRLSLLFTSNSGQFFVASDLELDGVSRWAG